MTTQQLPPLPEQSMTHHITDEQIGQIAEQVALVGPASRVGECHAASLRFARALLDLAAPAPQGEPVAYRIDYPGVTDMVGLRRWCGADEYESARSTIEYLGGVFVPLYTAPAPAVPSGWSITPNDDGTIAVQGPGLGVVVSGVETLERRIPGEVLHALCRAMLTAAPTPPAQSDDDEATIADYQEALRSVDALVRRLDIALNGEAGASPQARLCDIVSQVEARQQPAVPMTEEQATLLNQAHDMLLAHADYQRSRGNDSEAKGAECSADAVLKLASAWASAPAVPESADTTPPAQTEQPEQTAAVAALIGLNSAVHRVKSGNSEGAIKVIEHVRTVLASALPSQPAVPEDVARVNKQMLEALEEALPALPTWHRPKVSAAIDAARAAEKGGA